MSRWFRFYDGALDDPKVQALPGDLFKAWVNLLCVASRNSGRLPVDELAFFLRKSQVDVDEVIENLRERGLVDLVDDNLCPHNWSRRQFKSDVSNERVKRHRERQSNVACNVTEASGATPPDTDTDTDTEKKESRASARSDHEKITDEFEIWYAAYPRHIKRGDAQRAYRAARKTVGAETLLAGAKAAAKKYAGKDQQFTPYPGTWIRGEQWRDEDLQPPNPQEPVSNGSVYVDYSSEPGEAWAKHYRDRGRVPPGGSATGWYFPSFWPPGHVSHETSEMHE